MPDDYVSEDDLTALGVDPALISLFCPWAAELVGHGGVRCWSAEDLAPLLEGGAP